MSGVEDRRRRYRPEIADFALGFMDEVDRMKEDPAAWEEFTRLGGRFRFQAMERVFAVVDDTDQVASEAVAELEDELEPAIWPFDVRPVPTDPADTPDY